MNEKNEKAYTITFGVMSQPSIRGTPDRYAQDLKWTPETAVYNRPRSEETNEKYVRTSSFMIKKTHQ